MYVFFLLATADGRGVAGFVAVWPAWFTSEWMMKEIALSGAHQLYEGNCHMSMDTIPRSVNAAGRYLHVAIVWDMLSL